MSKYRVHVYPVMRCVIEVESETPEAAAKLAIEKATVELNDLARTGPSTGLHYADEIQDQVVVDHVDSWSDDYPSKTTNVTVSEGQPDAPDGAGQISKDGPTLFTIGEVARQLGIPMYSAQYLVRSRKVQPAAKAGIIRLFTAEHVKLLDTILLERERDSIEREFNGH